MPIVSKSAPTGLSYLPAFVDAEAAIRNTKERKNCLQKTKLESYEKKECVSAGKA
jgi:hypothetical protein